MSAREPLPRDLEARVLFDSDSTCCVCRLGSQPVQIHHIDGDPSNNTIENLAVLCLNHHTAAHTQVRFSRNLTPELIRLHNSSWREIVRVRRGPASADASRRALTSEVLLETSLNCHHWKTGFMRFSEYALPQDPAGRFSDIWDVMEASVDTVRT